MIKIKYSLIVSTAALFGLSQFTINNSAYAQDAVRIGTSSVGSVFYTIAVGASELITKHAKINATAEPVGGSSANVRGLGAKKIEFAIANSFASFTGLNGTHSFKKTGKVPIRLVLQGQASNRWLMVRKGANIKTAQDLQGKTIIAKRRALPEISIVMDAFMKVHGLPAGSIKLVSTTNTGQLVKAIRAGSVDAALMPFSPRAAQVEKPMADGVLDFFYTSDAKRTEMLKHLPPMIWANTMKKGIFSNMKKDAPVVSLNTYFITRPGVSNDTVYKVTKAILDHNKEFMTYHKAARQYSLKRALVSVSLPFHPGAIRYFKEKGVWTPALEANQKKLIGK
jgi:TRAP transporter TAXI family solute receptor